ncbi:MAG: hypothetical protein ACRCXB_31705 [Aeromonadaceae bacterium]
MGLAPEIPNLAPAIQLQQGGRLILLKKNGFYQVFIIFLMMQRQP